MAYTKLDAGLIHSTVWREPMPTRIVWITMLAMKDRHGEIRASVPGLADAARVSIEQCRAALKKLAAPDPDSRTKDFEGRRVEEIDGGWVVLNHHKYRDSESEEERKARAAERTRLWRERKAASQRHRDITKTSRNVTVTHADAHADTDSTNNTLPTLDEFCERMPAASQKTVWQMGAVQRDPETWAAAMLAMLNGMHPPAILPDTLAVALTEMAATSAKPSPANVRAFLRRLKTDAAKDAELGPAGKPLTEREKFLAQPD